MAVFYRGAGIGTYWHRNDARISGFVAQSPGSPASVDGIKRHIRNGTTVSAFISITRSYEIAWTYALYCGYAAPTAAAPAYVYEIEVDTIPPSSRVWKYSTPFVKSSMPPRLHWPPDAIIISMMERRIY